MIPILAKEHGFLMVRFENLLSCQSHCGYSAVACGELLPSIVFAKDNVTEDYRKRLNDSSIRLFMQLGVESGSVHCVSETP